ncbi:hypothetical protein SAMN02910400_01674 [Lachnospiraceae bacterium C10]|nr:hypothetical protein SAMN02910400_01674 [Lachnospiraceae bacterium C10]
MSRSFVRHSFKVGEHSRFVIYQKPSEYVTFKIGQWLAYIVIILPLKIVHYITASALKLVLNSIFALFYWIRSVRDRSTMAENEYKLENIYARVDDIAVIFGYLCEIAAIIFVISSLVTYFKSNDANKKDVEMTSEDRIEILEKSLGTSASVSDDVKAFIRNNNTLFKEKVKSGTAKGKTEAEVSLAEYCNNLDSYDGKFLRIKNATVNSVVDSRGMNVVELSYDKDLVKHSLNVYFYGSSGVMVGKKCHQPQCLC